MPSAKDDSQHWVQIWWHTSHGDILAFHTFLCYEPCKKGRAQKVERVENVQKVQMVWILDFRWPRRFIWSMKCNKSLNKKLQLLPILNKICLKRGQPSMRAVVRWEPPIYFVTVWEILCLHLATTILLCSQCETEKQHICIIAALVNKIHWTWSEIIWYDWVKDGVVQFILMGVALHWLYRNKRSTTNSQIRNTLLCQSRAKVKVI